MAKLIFGLILIVFLLGGVFFVGFVIGSTVTPLNDADASAPSALLSEVGHA